MKQIIIVRHAQAHNIDEWFSHDFYRTLTNIWQLQAKKVGVELKKIWAKPDCIITSSAPRAYQTALIASNEMNIDYQNIIIHSECYRCGIEKRLEVISYYKQHNSILICGHNPELLALCEHYNPKINELKKWHYYIFQRE